MDLKDGEEIGEGEEVEKEKERRWRWRWRWRREGQGLIGSGPILQFLHSSLSQVLVFWSVLPSGVKPCPVCFSANWEQMS